MGKVLTQNERCKKGSHIGRENSTPNYWKEGDDALKYKWNKVGGICDYQYTCTNCGHEQHWMTI